MSTRVKICGVTSVADAELCVDFGADFIGLNFHPPSPRYIDLATARQIATVVGGRCRLVAVVANASAEVVSIIVDEIAPDLVQFHGDESAAAIQPWSDRAIKACRVSGRPESGVLRQYADVWGFLLDTAHPDLLGGTGDRWHWSDLAPLDDGRPIFVAGGIDPDNVGQAIRTTRPYAIDVCSGVEHEPGRKKFELLERLFEEVRLARSSA